MRKAEISECELVAMKCVWDAGEPVRIGENAIEHLLRRFPVEREERLSDGCRGDEPLHAYAARNLAILEGEHRGGARAKRHAADV